jgi:hypothetical protein
MRRVVILVALSLAALAFLAPATNAGNPKDTQDVFLSKIPDLNATNGSVANISTLTGFQDTLMPVTLFRFELNDTKLPGPRYMAYGPSTIAFSLHPVLLVLLIITLGIITGLAYAVRRKRNARTEK